MNKRKRVRKKHVPERTCIACRTTHPKRELMRIVRTPEGHVVIDETGKQNGRGAYICQHLICWQKALKHGAFNRALRTTLMPEEIDMLQAYATLLPPTPSTSGGSVSDSGKLTEEE